MSDVYRICIYINSLKLKTFFNVQFLFELLNRQPDVLVARFISNDVSYEFIRRGSI